MSEQSYLSKEPKDVAAISHAVDMLAKGQQREVVGKRSSYDTFDPTPHTFSDDNLLDYNYATSTTNCETMIHLLKGKISPGILAFPKAFMNAGLWVGFAGIPIIGIICIYCIQTMLKCSRELSRCHNFPSLSYEETAEVCFKYGPRSFKGWSKIIGHIITSFLIMAQLGFCCAVRIQHLQKSR